MHGARRAHPLQSSSCDTADSPAEVMPGALSSLLSPKSGVRSQQGICPETLGEVCQDEITPVPGKVAALAVTAMGLEMLEGRFHSWKREL